MSATTNQTKSDASAATTIDEKRPTEGKYGAYHDPVAPQTSVIRKIVAESCSLNSGAAAVLLQIAAKGVGLGVSAHSSFTKRPIERARRSLFYIFVMAFGTEDERRFVTDATHRAHSHVKGTLGGARYDADDEDLQLWVAATMYWSMVTGYQDIFGALDEATADQAYREFSVMATGLRVPPGKWPADRAAFNEYWDRAVADLEITDEAREVAHEVMYPLAHLKGFFPRAYALVTGPTTRTITTELLPERVRNEFDMPTSLYTRAYYWLFLKANRFWYPLLPQFVRHAPKNLYMKDFRRRVAEGSRL